MVDEGLETSGGIGKIKLDPQVFIMFSSVDGWKAGGRLNDPHCEGLSDVLVHGFMFLGRQRVLAPLWRGGA